MPRIARQPLFRCLESAGHRKPRRLRDSRVLVTLVEAGGSRLKACQRVAGGRSAAETSGRIQEIKHSGGVPERSSIDVPNLGRASRLRSADVLLRGERHSKISHHRAPPIRTQLSEASASGFYGRAYQLRRRDFPNPGGAVDLGCQHASAVLVSSMRWPFNSAFHS